MSPAARVALIAGLAALLLAGVAAAHSLPARRSIAVQAEKDALVVLAVWTAPAGEPGAVFDLTAALASRGKARAALEARLAARALGPLRLMIDGEPLVPGALHTRLVEDPPRSGRHAVAVLAEAAIPAGAHEVTVTLGPTGDATRMSFLDRSSGAAVASGRVPDGLLAPPGTTFTIRWKEPR